MLRRCSVSASLFKSAATASAAASALILLPVLRFPSTISPLHPATQIVHSARFNSSFEKEENGQTEKESESARQSKLWMKYLSDSEEDVDEKPEDDDMKVETENQNNQGDDAVDDDETGVQKPKIRSLHAQGTSTDEFQQQFRTDDEVMVDPALCKDTLALDPESTVDGSLPSAVVDNDSDDQFVDYSSSGVKTHRTRSHQTKFSGEAAAAAGALSSTTDEGDGGGDDDLDDLDDEDFDDEEFAEARRRLAILKNNASSVVGGVTTSQAGAEVGNTTDFSGTIHMKPLVRHRSSVATFNDKEQHDDVSKTTNNTEDITEELKRFEVDEMGTALNVAPTRNAAPPGKRK